MPNKVCRTTREFYYNTQEVLQQTLISRASMIKYVKSVSSLHLKIEPKVQIGMTNKKFMTGLPTIQTLLSGDRRKFLKR